MDHISELTSFAQTLFADQFGQTSALLQKEYQKERNRDEIKKIFQGLFMKADSLERHNKEIAYLGICYLHSSLLTGSYELLLSLYDESLYLDSDPIEVYWKPSTIFAYFERDLEEIIPRLRNKYIRLQQYELSMIKKLYAEYYYAVIQKLCKDMCWEILSSEYFSKIHIGGKFKVFFGRYRGEGRTLYCLEGDAHEVFHTVK